MEKWNFKPFMKLIKEADDERTSDERLVEIAKKVAATNDPYLICDFCEFCERADSPSVMPILQRVIEQNNNPLHVYEFAYLMADCGKKCVNYGSLLQRVIESGDPKLVCYSREFVPAFDGVRLDMAMSRLGNKRWLEHYNELTGFLEGGSYEAKALSQRLALVEKLASEGKVIVPDVIKSRVPDMKNGLVDAYNHCLSVNDPYLITNMLENFPRMERSGRLTQRLFDMGDIMSIYEYGASCETANVAKVTEAAKQSNMPKYMYYVGAYCPGADAEALLSAIKSAVGVPEEMKVKYAKKLEEHIRETSSEPGGDE